MYRIRPEWNRRGPAIPAWFRRSLTSIHPGLVMQYVPPGNPDGADGADPARYPDGLWNVHVRMPNTRDGLLPRVVWCCVDLHGRWSPPTPRVLKLIRTAYGLWRNKRDPILEKLLDQELKSYALEQCLRSRDKLRTRIDRQLTQAGQRTNTGRIAVPRRIGIGSVP